MIQLKINGVPYPEVRQGAYRCYQKDLGETERMISGRLTTELRARVWVIEYSVEYMSNDFMRHCLSDLRSADDLTVDFLTPLSDELKSSLFRCTVRPTPAMEWSFGGQPLWRNISFTLEQVRGE